MNAKDSGNDGGGIKIICQNRRAFHDFIIDKKLEAGIELKGSEVKSCREGRVQLVDSYAFFEKHELFLLKASISEYKQGGPYFNHEPSRKRRLLLHKRELKNLRAQVEQEGATLIPLKFYFKKGRVKVELGLARGKTKGDKRQSTKDREDSRNMDRALRRQR